MGVKPTRAEIFFNLKYRPLLRLFFISLASAGLYLILAIKFPLEPSLVEPRAGWVSLTGDGLPWVIIQVVIYFCLFLLYSKAIRQLQPAAPAASQSKANHPINFHRANLVVIFGWLGCCAILLTSAAAGESHDIFDYVFRGRMMVEYQANPLVYIPKRFDRAHYYLYTAWYNNVDTYGPLWEMASAGIAAGVHAAAPAFGGLVLEQPSCPESLDSCRWLVVYLTGYRLLAILLTGVSAVLITKIMQNVQPALVSAALAAWLWNPLTLMASAVGGHNDFLMLVLFLASLLLLRKRRYFLALLCLILAAHVKLTALIWAPVVFLWIVRKLGWRSGISLGARAMAAGLVVSWVLYLPFSGWASLPQMLNERTLYFANSIWNVFYRFFVGQPGWLILAGFYLTQHLPNWLSVAGATIIPLVKFHILVKPERTAPIDDGDRGFWVTVTAVGLFYLIWGAFWFQHWYLLWVLAPAVLLANHTFTLDINPWLGFGALTANFLAGFFLSSIPDGIQKNLVYLLIVIIIWAPGLAAALAAKRSGRKLWDVFIHDRH